MQLFQQALHDQHELNVRSTFRVHPRVPRTVREPECIYVQDATLNHFKEWVEGKQIDDTNPFQRYDRNEFWAYADYMHFGEIFGERTEAAAALLDWSSIGIGDAPQPTFWLGSAGAHTPLHFDTYGTNVVVQLHGEKRWTLFPPSATELLKPTRIPFEESSVYSGLDIRQLDGHSATGAAALCQTAVLRPGDVLFVPRHWWHFVECTSTAMSVNLWMDHPDDPSARVTEALARVVVTSMQEALESQLGSEWLSPTEEEWTPDQAMEMLQIAVQSQSSAGDAPPQPPASFQDVLDALLAPTTLQHIARQLTRR
ncbi:hypothetical protein JKP88DRAFT_338118 [Tribonema minus]|uniref:JmjC domain-containing protein n=1 Tax=Tribonema minus TaxID=303371 RepID=A0A836C731_9STRA|nr:hypothetical protein JKP88DRAFT_338118 [Tribonema minus]